MALLHNIRTVARYEAKTLRRSWFFRLFSMGAVFILTIMNIGLFSPVGGEEWSLVAISSSVALVNLYLLNIGQSIVVIFLAADFLKRDKKLDTNEVLYTRSMSNLEYITGKTWGILRLFLGLNIIILLIGMLMNIISKNMSVDLPAYISYLLIITVPTIVFSLGLAFLLMSVVRNQAITFLLLLGIAALDMFYLWFRAGFIFDYMAFGLPVFKSGIIGFDDTGLILRQRLLYLFLGLTFVFATVLLFKRLPQSKFHRIVTIILLNLFLAGAGYCGLDIYNEYNQDTIFKKQIIEINRRYENRIFTSVSEAAIDIIHKGEFIDASASLKILNDSPEPLDTILLALNPSLKVSEISSDGKRLQFTRRTHLIEIAAGKVLYPGDTDSLRIEYAGMVNESFCYPDYTDNVKVSPYRIAMVNVHKRQAFLTPGYVLLTPETYWYPVAALNYYPDNPARIKIDFTKYSLHVKTGKGLTPVSQGRMVQEGEYTAFKPDKPLTGLTLVIGKYMSDTLKVDSVEYITYFYPGHDYYNADLNEIKDTLPALVSGIMRDLETNFSTGYPFSTLSLVEVPVQFYSYARENTQTRAEVQPSMVLLPEKLSTLNNAGFQKRFTRQKKRMARNNQVITDKELQVRLFNDFIRNVFISGENYHFVNGVPSNEPLRYRLGPSFYFFRNNFYSSEFPVINALFESHLQKLTGQVQGSDFMTGFGALSDIDKANLILKKTSFRDLLAASPSGDTLRSVLSVKGDWFFNYLRAKAGPEEFNSWFTGYINSNSFKKTDLRKFNDDIRAKFGFEFYPVLESWFNDKDQPGFLFSDLSSTEIIAGDRTRYQVTYIVSNPERAAGLFNIAFQTGREGSGQNLPAGGSRFLISGQGRGMDASGINSIVLIGPGETKRIGVILDEEPRAMLVNTLVSKNIPGEIILPFGETGKAEKSLKAFTGQVILHLAPPLSESSEIIVDNEDPGFVPGGQNSVSPLKKLLGIRRRSGIEYTTISLWNTPEYWQPAVNTTYYGRYVRSAVYTRAGTGDRLLTWTAVLKDPGYYDIYTYVGKTTVRMSVKSGTGPAARTYDDQDGDQDGNYKDMHYRIHHDEGVDDITLDYQKSEGGWNNLGRYYISSDTGKVELTNKSSGRIVIGDAIKWVKE